MSMQQWLDKKGLSVERLREYVRNAKESQWERPAVSMLALLHTVVLLLLCFCTEKCLILVAETCSFLGSCQPPAPEKIGSTHR